MTVSSATTRNSYSGNASTTAFAYGFKIFATTDLEVVIRSAAGVETIKTLSTHYSVSGAGVASGGNVTFGSAPASGETVIIRRKLTLTQGTDYVENDSFPANSHEDALDRLTMITQQIQEEVGRSVKASTTTTLTTPTFTEAAADRANKFLGFDATGNTVAVTDGPLPGTEIDSLADAHVLLYDNGDSRWENKAVSGDIAITAAGVTSISAGAIVNADVSGSAAIVDTKLATITTADKVSGAAVQVDGAADGTGITLADADKILVDDAGTTKYVNMSQVNAYTSSSVAADDIAVGDAAASFATSSGAVVVDSQASTTTIDGHTGVTVQSSNSGDITLDSVADINLDAAGNDVVFKSAGTSIGSISNSSSDLVITASVADKNIDFKGTDGSAGITALSIDMATAGKATFLGDVAVGANIELGHASDTTLARSGSGDVTIEGNAIYRAGGTDVPVADGGTGASSLTDGGVLLGSGTSAVTAMAVLTDGQMIVGDGTGDPVAESGATLRTSIGVGTGDSPTFTNVTASTALLPDASGGADLGSASLEWGDVYVADNKFIKLGNDQDFTIEYDEDGQDTTRVVAAGGVTLSPHGTSSGNTTALKFGELAAGGTNYVGFKAPDALAGDVTWTLPNADGSDGQVLKTNGSSVLSWVGAPSGAGTGDNTDIDSLTLAAGSVGSPSLSKAGDTNSGLTFLAADTVSMVTGGVEQFRFGSNPIPGGSKNMVINGSMKVAQRGTLTGLGAAQAYTSADMWKLFIETTAARVTTSVEAAPAAMIADGFANALKIDVTTVDSSPADSDFIGVEQRFEGQDLQHLLYGTAGAKELTVSFWFQSPKSGTHHVYLVQNDGNYGCPMTFTVASADTAEKFSVTFPALTTSGQDFDNDNAFSMALGFPLMSNGYESTANQWNSGGTWRSTSAQQNLTDHVDNLIYVGGIQLELGSCSTSYAHRSFADELVRAQRYFERLDFNFSNGEPIGNGVAGSTSSFLAGVPFRVKKRAAPTLSSSAASTFDVLYAGGAVAEVGAINSLTSGQYHLQFVGTGVAGSPLTDGASIILRRDATDTTFIDISAEL